MIALQTDGTSCRDVLNLPLQIQSSAFDTIDLFLLAIILLVVAQFSASVVWRVELCRRVRHEIVPDGEVAHDIDWFTDDFAAEHRELENFDLTMNKIETIPRLPEITKCQPFLQFQNEL